MVQEQLEEVRQNIRNACERSGRKVEDVTLIAVSKTKPVPMLQEAYDAGARDFGENKVQEILEKEPQLPSDIRWHMIGHLQKNKVRQVIDKAVLIHSVDTVGLAEQIEKEAVKRDLDVSILLEVNVAGEESKFGFAPEEVEEAAREIAKYPHVHIQGLMTIAPFVENSEENRGVFKKLYELYDIYGTNSSVWNTYLQSPSKEISKETTLNDIVTTIKLIITINAPIIAKRPRCSKILLFIPLPPLLLCPPQR